jgi:hypothetical protein
MPATVVPVAPACTGALSIGQAADEENCLQYQLNDGIEMHSDAAICGQLDHLGPCAICTRGAVKGFTPPKNDKYSQEIL